VSTYSSPHRFLDARARIRRLFDPAPDFPTLLAPALTFECLDFRTLGLDGIVRALFPPGDAKRALADGPARRASSMKITGVLPSVPRAPATAIRPFRKLRASRKFVAAPRGSGSPRLASSDPSSRDSPDCTANVPTISSLSLFLPVAASRAAVRLSGCAAANATAFAALTLPKPYSGL
jgi:hypothetical protein